MKYVCITLRALTICDFIIIFSCVGSSVFICFCCIDTEPISTYYFYYCIVASKRSWMNVSIQHEPPHIRCCTVAQMCPNKGLICTDLERRIANSIATLTKCGTSPQTRTPIYRYKILPKRRNDRCQDLEDLRYVWHKVISIHHCYQLQL